MRFAKRCALFLHSTLFLGLLALVVTLGLPGRAYAYVDPSVMTYAIQALAGVAVALSAVIGVAFRRSRRALMRLLGIDEDAKKEHDPVVHELSPDSPDYAKAIAEADVSALERKARLSKSLTSDRPLTWPLRFVRALLASVFAIGTVFVMAPIEIVSGSGTSLVFSTSDILVPVLVVSGVAMLVLAFVLSLLRGRTFTIAIGIVCAIGLGCYLQALFLNISLPIADGQALSLWSHKRMTAISALVWIALVGGFVMLAVKKPRVERASVIVVSACLIIVQAAGAIGIMADQQSDASADKPRTVITREGLFDLSENGNVVVFVLDMFDTATMDQVLEDDPSALDEFTGFTYYRDSAGSMVPTRYGVKYLLTGRVPEGDEEFYDFYDSWLADSTLLSDISDAGYNVDIYTDTLGDHTDDAAKLADNIHEEGDSARPDIPGTLVTLAKVSLYRDMPWALKPLFWFSTEDLNNAYIGNDPSQGAEYLIDDAFYGDMLRNGGLTLNGEDNSFRFIHLMGAHYPYTLDAQGKRTGETDLVTQSEGSLSIVSDYLREMKRLGIYDNATIVVTADHGIWRLRADELDYASSPIMLVKPAETAEEAASPLQVSDVPTGHLDYPATIIAAVGGDASKYGTPVWDVPEGDRPRYYWTTFSDGKHDTEWQEYEIDGNALDLDNWHKTDKRIEIPIGERPSESTESASSSPSGSAPESGDSAS